ncbi:oligogalacturonate-specific porin KdgM family protein [Acerihabitans sp. TG2]|uniref:oligogalacturonate-specific porin KdgM family protein n=1 Tax=Acerihabitans sp. TG2 TaxID=3096008 RepID=UPI002B22835A|nr:oligogalacturonate-specific porin KdgM family protein [Acerihabitans sp. TG2]MEA9391308.1 oligogalacturonate-specific porin KdgM family protein [Acerihabitans sp. TG2]
MMDTKSVALIFAIFPLSCLATDGKTTFQYEHNWKTMDRRHSDSIKLIHKLTSGWSYEVKFSTSAGGNSNYDTAYDDMQGGSGGLVIGKDFKLSDKKSTITPSFETSIGSSSVSYQPGIKYNYSINKEWSAYARYRYELKKISRSTRYSTISNSDKYGYAGDTYLSKSDTGRHRLDTGLTYSGFKDLALTYVFNYYLGDNVTESYSYKNGKFIEKNYTVHNGKKNDYENQFKIQYKYFKKLMPYLEVDDVTVSGTSASRQAKIKIGFNYVF